eukprot:g33738.t1
MNLQEMVVDSTFNFEKKRLTPTRYNRNLMIKTVRAMQIVERIRQVRKERFHKARLAGQLRQRQTSAQKEVARSAHLLEGPNKEKALHYQKDRAKEFAGSTKAKSRQKVKVEKTASGAMEMQQNATMVPGRKPPRRKESKVVVPLTKSDVMRVTAAEAQLQPFQDEKLEIYCREHEDIAASFQEAREGRGVLAKLYVQRNKEILDRLVAERSKSDKDAKMNLDQLKDFCKEFVDTVAEKKKAWRQKFADDSRDIITRSTRMSDTTIASLDAAILEEHEDSHFTGLTNPTGCFDEKPSFHPFSTDLTGEDCLAHAAAETEPLLAALKQHNEFLEAQIVERTEENDRFMNDMQTRFHYLRPGGCRGETWQEVDLTWQEESGRGERGPTGTGPRDAATGRRTFQRVGGKG